MGQVRLNAYLVAGDEAVTPVFCDYALPTILPSDTMNACGQFVFTTLLAGSSPEQTAISPKLSVKCGAFRGRIREGVVSQARSQKPLVPFGAGNEPMRLLCLPHAEPAQVSTRAWARGLPIIITACPVQPQPGKRRSGAAN